MNEAAVSTVAANPSPSLRLALVVDDDVMVRHFVALCLRHAQYQVLEAADPLEAQRLVCQNPTIHLVVTDCQMPEMNGAALAEWFQTTWPQIKVLLMSGSPGMEALIQEALSPAAFLAKPFNRDQLLQQVRTLEFA